MSRREEVERRFWMYVSGEKVGVSRGAVRGEVVDVLVVGSVRVVVEGALLSSEVVEVMLAVRER